MFFCRMSSTPASGQQHPAARMRLISDRQGKAEDGEEFDGGKGKGGPPSKGKGGPPPTIKKYGFGTATDES